MKKGCDIEFLETSGSNPTMSKCGIDLHICDTKNHTPIVTLVYRVILTEPIQIQTAFFPNRVAVEPAAPRRIVEAQAVVVQAGLGVEILGREAEFEIAGHEAGLGKRISKSIVLVVGDGASTTADILRDVAVVVVAREIEVAADADRNQSAHAMNGVGEVVAPKILDFGDG